MLLTIDVGNTTTVLGVFAGTELRDHWRIATDHRRTADELALLVRGLLAASPESVGAGPGAVSAKGEFLGGAIAPGVEISVDALGARGAQLLKVELARPRSVIGKNTVEALQSG